MSADSETINRLDALVSSGAYIDLWRTEDEGYIAIAHVDDGVGNPVMPRAKSSNLLGCINALADAVYAVRQSDVYGTSDIVINEAGEQVFATKRKE